MKKLILASASKRRSDILKSCRMPHRIIKSDVKELLKADKPVSEIVMINAQRKADAVAVKHKNAVIISADTLVAHGKKIIGKPKDKNEAQIILSRFSGNRIEVYTGLCVLDTSTSKKSLDYDKSEILVSKIRRSEIKKYFRLLGPYDKAGGFSIEGVGSIFFDNIKGSYFNILGLPIMKLKKLFNEIGLDILDFINPSITPRPDVRLGGSGRGIYKGHTKRRPLRGRRNEKTILEAPPLNRAIQRSNSKIPIAVPKGKWHGFAARMYKMKTHYTIPFFIPFKGCPYKCIFCDQNKITGHRMIKNIDFVKNINKYLSTIPIENTYIEAGFFGGTFTGLPITLQERLLKPVQPYIKEGRIKGIRISTRPDFISENILDHLKSYNVTCIELGVQSMSNKVLKTAKRGHTAKDIERASKMIIAKGFKLGHQIMVGLPQSTTKDEMHTARYVKKLGAKEVRIYPVVVIKNTELAGLWKKGAYIPLSEKEAIERCAKLILFFEANNIKVIRCGLHPSENLLNGNDLLAGPFHPAFGLKVRSYLFALKIKKIPNGKTILYNPEDEPALFGYKRENCQLLNSIKPSLRRDAIVPRGTVIVE